MRLGYATEGCICDFFAHPFYAFSISAYYKLGLYFDVPANDPIKYQYQFYAFGISVYDRLGIYLDLPANDPIEYQ